MIDFKERRAISPLTIVFSVVIGMHLILAFLNPTNVFQLLTIIIIIFLFSHSIITIIFNLSPIFLSFLQRINNILPAIILILLTSVTIFDNTALPTFNTELIYILLIFTLIIIGCITIGLALINNSFPKWHRQINILIGSFSIILSLITIIAPILGYTFLTIVICALVSISKTKLLEIF